MIGYWRVPLPERLIVPESVFVVPFTVTVAVPDPLAVIDQVMALVGMVKVEPLATDTKYGVKGCPHPT
jgi:hypothetical protein